MENNILIVDVIAEAKTADSEATIRRLANVGKFLDPMKSGPVGGVLLQDFKCSLLRRVNFG